jgi:hypothetical protein
MMPLGEYRPIDPPQPRLRHEEDPDPREPQDEYPDDDLDGPPDAWLPDGWWHDDKP